MRCMGSVFKQIDRHKRANKLSHFPLMIIQPRDMRKKDTKPFCRSMNLLEDKMLKVRNIALDSSHFLSSFSVSTHLLLRCDVRSPY